MRNQCVFKLFSVIFMTFLSLKPLKTMCRTESPFFALKVVTMMSSVSAAMEACDAGSLETIPGWNMLNGFLGKSSCLHF